MDTMTWILIALATVGGIWAIAATWVAKTYRDQVTNVQMAAGIARDQNSGLRAVNEALVKMVRAFESEVAATKRYASVLEQMNRMLIAAQPKPRAPRTRKAPVNSRKAASK